MDINKSVETNDIKKSSSNVNELAVPEVSLQFKDSSGNQGSRNTLILSPNNSRQSLIHQPYDLVIRKIQERKEFLPKKWVVYKPFKEAINSKLSKESRIFWCSHVGFILEEQKGDDSGDKNDC